MTAISISKWDLIPFIRGTGVYVGDGTAPFKHMMRFGPGQLRMLGCAVVDFVCLHGKQVTLDTIVEAWRLLRSGGRLVVWGDLERPVNVPEAIPGGWDWIWHDEDKTSFLQAFQIVHHGERRERIPARPARCAAVVRPGGKVGYGDALWASSVIAQLAGMGYHVTAYVDSAGEEALRHDPHVGRFIVDSYTMIGLEELPRYWEHEAGRYDLWVNLSQAVESSMLFDPSQLQSTWPKAARAEVARGNYLERLHTVAGLPYVPQQRFYETEFEAAVAREVRGEYADMVVLADTGTTETKWWPHMARLADMLVAESDDLLVVVLGKVRSKFSAHPRIRVLGMTQTWREAAAIAIEADLVIGPETGLLNAVAFEQNAKIVLLSHSSEENLTRDWVRTEAIGAGHVPCHPCHILHFDGFKRCVRDVETDSALCQAVLKPEWVLAAVRRALPIKVAA